MEYKNTTETIDNINEINANRQDMKELHVGDIVKGEIVSVNNQTYHVLVGTTIFYLPKSEISWNGRKRTFLKGDIIESVVIKILDNNIIILSIKRLREDPWKNIKDYLYVGMKVSGIVIDNMGFGILVELNNSVVALLHRNTIGLSKEKLFKDYVSIGNEIEVEILTIDTAKKKVSLKCDSFFEQFQKHN